MPIPRRSFLQSAAAAALFDAPSVLAQSSGKPRLGVVTSATTPADADRAIARVHALGMPTCQVGLGAAPDPNVAAPLKQALAKYGVEATAVMTLGPGRMVWDFANGPATIGLVPRDTRAARIDALKRASDVAHACGIPAVHTHCGFLPEIPSDPLYAEAVKAIHEVTAHCRANGQTFLMETGQETPITLLRAIEDVGLDNVAVNLDMANLILYDKGEPVGALDVIGRHVRGTHAKDGLYPTDPRSLGREVPIGQGRVNFVEVMRRLRQLNYSGPITIEREIEGARQQADILSSKRYLEQLIDRTWA